MENKMDKVAEILGVEIGEKFKIQYPNGEISDCYYRFTENGIYGDDHSVGSRFLLNLVIGKYTILKSPWKPVEGELYFYIDQKGTVYGTSFSETCLYDFNLYKLGNCYCTKEEAEANRDKWIEFYTSDEVLKI